MKNVLIILVILNFGCTTKKAKMQTTDNVDTVSSDVEVYDPGITRCVYERSDKRRANTFPFDKCDKIELLSYRTRHDATSNDQLIHDGKFIFAKEAQTKIEQRVTLTESQADSLFSILHRFKKVRQGNVEAQADCYNPRHAAVFYQRGKAIAFLEVCFECQETRQTVDIDFGEFCDEKWCDLQRFFKAAGADFELIDEMCE